MILLGTHPYGAIDEPPHQFAFRQTPLNPICPTATEQWAWLLCSALTQAKFPQKPRDQGNRWQVSAESFKTLRNYIIKLDPSTCVRLLQPVRIYLATLLAVATTMPAWAGDPLSTTFHWEAGSDPGTPITAELDTLGQWTVLADGSTVYTGSMISPTWHLTWTTKVNDTNERLIDTVLSVTNLDATTQEFIAGTTLNSPLNDVSSLLSLATSVSLTNLQFTGSATLSTTDSSPLIAAEVGSATAATLFDAVYTLTASGPFGSVTDSADSLTPLEPLDLASLSVWTRFMLTPGDSTTLHILAATSTVPAPPAAMALVMAWSLHRRRTRSC